MLKNNKIRYLVVVFLYSKTKKSNKKRCFRYKPNIIAVKAVGRVFFF